MKPDRGDRIRKQLAIEAARLMVDSGIKDFYTAKRKAASRLGIPNTTNLPRNTEIEQALNEHLALFKQHSQPIQLRYLRETTLRIMRILERFNPHLVGAVLAGTADRHSAINLHVFADRPEDIARHLIEEAIPYRAIETRLNQSRGQPIRYPAYLFLAGETEVEITVFPVDGIRQAPLSAVDGKPMKRASLSEVDQLVSQQL